MRDIPPPSDVIRTQNRLWSALLPKLALSIVLGLLFALLLMKGGLPLLPPRDLVESVPPWAIPLYLLTLTITHLLRATRFRFLISHLKKLPLREIIALNWIGFFAIFAFPLRLGEMARPLLTKLRHEISIGAGLGTIAVERVIDGMITSACVAYGLFYLPTLPANDPLAAALPDYGLLALVAFSGAFIGVIAFLFNHERAARLTESLLGTISRPFARFVSEKLSSVADGLRSIASPRLFLLFTLESLAYWGVNALGMWALALALGLPIGFGETIGVMGIMAIGMLLPAGPGLFGSFQLGAALGLALYLPDAIVTREGALFIFLLYTCQAVFVSLAGLIPLYALKLPLSSLIRSR